MKKPTFLFLLFLLPAFSQAVDAPMPSVEGSQIRWSPVNALSINVHRSDGSYIESLPGDAGSWVSTAPGAYYLVATTTDHWSTWGKSQTVTVVPDASSEGFQLDVDVGTLRWSSLAYDHTINVHTSDGVYVTSIPGGNNQWNPQQTGEYYVVAATSESWQSWKRSNVVTFDAEGASTGSLELTAFGEKLVWQGVPADNTINIHQADGSYVSSISAMAGSFSPGYEGEFYIVVVNGGDSWEAWPRSNNVVLGSAANNSTQVDFEITVPAYQSNELQVRLVWGDIDMTASWIGDESWSTSADFPTDTEHTLSVSFSDKNGAIVLGTFEQLYRTGINASETYTISSDQFNTESLDTDEDGVSNIDELISGTDPLVDEDALLEVRDFVVINYAVTASSNFESRITEERPYTESFNTSLPPVEFHPEIETHSVDISINDFGDGTLFDRFTHGLSGNSRTLRGTRFSGDGSVTWTGTWDFFNRQANGNSTSLDITNTVTYVDSTTRDYTDVVSATRSEFYFRSWQITSNLRGTIIEGSRLCEPVSGNVSMEVRTNATTGSASRIEFISTNISKQVDDPYWRVVVENSIESPTETIPSEGSEYFARNLRVLLLDVNVNSGVGGEDSVFEEASFICDLVELR